MRIDKGKKNRKLTLSQSEYIRKSLESFILHNAKLVNTPLASHFILTKEMCPKDKEEMDYMYNVLYE